MSLLATKLFIPQVRPGLVQRLRLIERLNAALPRKLTLVSAPAGSGKTKILSEWLANSDWPVAWLSLDESDNDPVRFLAYFIGALQTVEAGIGKGALSALQAPQPPIEALLTTLINEIAAIPGPLVRCLQVFIDHAQVPSNHAQTRASQEHLL